MTGRTVAVGIVAGLGLAVLWLLWPRPHLVLDCQGGAGGCVMRELESALVDCVPWKPESCSKTTLGLREISYLADPLTQVSSPFTQELFSVEFLPVRLDRPWDLEFLPVSMVATCTAIASTGMQSCWTRSSS